MAFLDSIVAEALSERKSRALIPSALFTLGLGSILYGFKDVQVLADNLVLDALLFGIGLCGILGADTHTVTAFGNVLDPERLLVDWTKKLSFAHDIMANNRSVLDDVKSSGEKWELVKTFLPTVAVKTLSFYMAALSLLFGINEITVTTSSTNLLGSLVPVRIGFFGLLLFCACAVSVFLKPTDAGSDNEEPNNNLEYPRQMLNSYFVDNVGKASQAEGLFFRAIIPMFALPLTVEMKRMKQIGGIYEFEGLTKFLEGEKASKTIAPIKDDDFERLKTVTDKGMLRSETETGHKLSSSVPDLLSLKRDELLQIIMLGQPEGKGASCRFNLVERKGIVTVVALRGCSVTIRRQMVPTLRFYFTEEPTQKAVFSVFGFGENAAISDFELELNLAAKGVNSAEFVPCKD